MESELSSQRRRELKALAHKLKPVVLIGAEGLSNNVLAEIDRSLKTHELIKVRVFGGERRERRALMATVCERTGAFPLQHIGKILVLYRENPEKLAPTTRAAPAAPLRRRPGASDRRTLHWKKPGRARLIKRTSRPAREPSDSKRRRGKHRPR